MAEISTYTDVTPVLTDRSLGIDVSDTDPNAGGETVTNLHSDILALYAAAAKTLLNTTLDADGTGNSITNIGSSEIKVDIVTGLSIAGAFASGDKFMIASSGSLEQADYDDLPGAGAINNIVEDVTPELGAHLDGKGFDITGLGTLSMTEQAAANSFVAGDGQVWVKTATPNELWFTDDAGTDFQIASLAGTEIFTNKTMDGDLNTFQDIPYSAIKSTSRSGLDVTLITGTAGTAADLAVWNADGDLVDGPTPPSGAIVGTTDTQALTGKTLDADGAGNVITNIGSSEIKAEMVTGQSAAAAFASGDKFLIVSGGALEQADWDDLPSASGMNNLVEDTTPQLGGVLDTFGQQVRWSQGADVASGAALTLGADGNYFDITGIMTITSIATLAIGTTVLLQFDDALTLTHHATNLILPTGANITTAAGDHAIFTEYGAGTWRCSVYYRADGTSLAFDIAGLTNVNNLGTGDTFPFYDSSNTGNRKIPAANMLEEIIEIATTETALAEDDWLGGMDISDPNGFKISVANLRITLFDGQGEDLNNMGVLFLTEQAAAEAFVAGKGQIWVKTATPNQLWFTDDGDTDRELVYAGGAYHDGMSDFVANEHIDHTAVTLTAGTGLTGGGDISTNRSFAVNGILEDLDTLGAPTADGEFIVATAAGVFAYETGATARTSLGVAIGSDVQAYDADTLKADLADVVTVGYAQTPYNAGSQSGAGTYTPDEANGNMQYATNDGAHTLAPPTNNCTIIIQYTNHATTAGTITTSGFTVVDGDALTITGGDDFLMQIVKINGFSSLTVKALQ